MKSLRSACQHASVCFPLYRSFSLCSSTGRCTSVDFASRTVITQPCLPDVNHFQRERAAGIVSVAPLSYVPGRKSNEVSLYQSGVHMMHKAAANPPPYLSSCTPYANAPKGLVNIQSLFEEDVIAELCSKLAHFPTNDRAEGLVTLLGVCVQFGLEAHSPPVLIVVKESLELLSNKDIGVVQLCNLGKVACALEGRQSPMVSKVINSISMVLEDDVVSPSEAAAIYSLMTVLYDPVSQEQALMLPALHKHAHRLVHKMKAHQVSDVLQSLVRLQQRQAISLVQKLSHRASRVFKAFSDDEISKVLAALLVLGQQDEKLLVAMEKHLPERIGRCDPELISTIMEYCLQTRCRSEPIFEAVAENFVTNAEKYTDLQIAKQIVTMGRLNYLPQCSNQMFKKVESILSERFAQFQPRLLIDLLHACIHLERFPLNYLSKVFSPYFLQKMQEQGEALDKNTLGQLTQLHLSTSLECTYYWGPRLPFFFHTKKFSSVDQVFETPMESLLYKQVQVPLARLLGGKFYYTRISAPIGYTIDVEICLDENGFILPTPEWEHTYKRIAICLDGQNRFCSNTQHLLGKETTKRRHLSKIGYELVQIPYFEFEKLKTLEEQIRYLHNKISPIISKFRYNQTR